MQNITLYNFNDLDKNGQDKALQQFILNQKNSDYLFDSILSDLSSSLKAICRAYQVDLLDYSFGLGNRNSFVKIGYDNEQDSLQYFEDFLTINKYPQKNGIFKFPGICAFTGVCYDDDILERIYNNLKNGDNIYDAFNDLTNLFSKILEDEYDYLTSKEYALQMIDMKDDIYDIEGNILI